MEPLISQVLLIGDRLPFLTALVTINPAAAETLKGMEPWKGRPAAEIAASPPVLAEIRKAVARVNKQLAPFEQVRKYACCRAIFPSSGRTDRHHEDPARPGAGQLQSPHRRVVHRPGMSNPRDSDVPYRGLHALRHRGGSSFVVAVIGGEEPGRAQRAPPIGRRLTICPTAPRYNRTI